MTLWQRITAALGPHRLLRAMCLYPPYLGAGVRVTRADEGLRRIDVEMRLTSLNRNYVGTHFGGSLYAMCDPFHMLMLIERLGPEFIVWDKSASIDFLRPGRGRVRASFEISDQRLAEIRDEVERQGRAHPRFEVVVVDESGAAVARVSKLLSVRKKPAA
jgi:acyl-coenzyme A thioesterase PaaI-like protein